MPAAKKRRKPGIQIERLPGSDTETESYSGSEPTDEQNGSGDESSEVEQAESELGSSEDEEDEEEVKEESVESVVKAEASKPDKNK